MTAANRDYTVEFSSSPSVSKLVSEFAVFQFSFRVLSDFFLFFYLLCSTRQLSSWRIPGTVRANE